MTNSDQDHEQTAGGPLGRAIGRAKEAVGSAIGNEDLAREGQIQKLAAETEEEAAAQAEQAATVREQAGVAAERAETETRRRQLEAELSNKAQFDAIEGQTESTLAAADRRSHHQNLAAETEERAEQEAAAARERIATAAEASELGEADSLRREAARARDAADAIDPEETD